MLFDSFAYDGVYKFTFNRKKHMYMNKVTDGLDLFYAPFRLDSFFKGTLENTLTLAGELFGNHYDDSRIKPSGERKPPEMCQICSILASESCRINN